MSIEVNSLRSVRAYVEPAGDTTYGADHSATPEDFIDLPITEGFAMPGPERDMLDPMVSQVRLDGRVKRVAGKRSGAAQLAMCLAGHGVPMIGNETPPGASTWALYRLLLAIMGGVSVTGTEAGATTVQSGTTTTAVTVTTGHGDRWGSGGGQVIGCTTANGFEAREVLSVTGDVVSVKEAFSGIPTTGTNVSGGVTFYPTEDPDTSLQLIAQGREADDNFLLTGMQGGFQIEAKPGQLAKITFDLKGDSCTKLAAHSGINVPTFANYEPIAVVGSELTMPVVGSTTRVAPGVSDVTLALGFAYEPVTGYGRNNVRRMRRMRPRDGVLAKITGTLPFEDGTWITARDDRENRAAFWQIGSTPGATVLISIPTVQVTQVPRAASASQLSGIQFVGESRHDASAVASTTPLSYAAFRVHFL